MKKKLPTGYGYMSEVVYPVFFLVICTPSGRNISFLLLHRTIAGEYKSICP